MPFSSLWPVKLINVQRFYNSLLWTVKLPSRDQNVYADDDDDDDDDGDDDDDDDDPFV